MSDSSQDSHWLMWRHCAATPKLLHLEISNWDFSKSTRLFSTKFRSTPGPRWQESIPHFIIHRQSRIFDFAKKWGYVSPPENFNWRFLDNGSTELNEIWSASCPRWQDCVSGPIFIQTLFLSFQICFIGQSLCLDAPSASELCVRSKIAPATVTFIESEC